MIKQSDLIVDRKEREAHTTLRTHMYSTLELIIDGFGSTNHYTYVV